MHASYLIVQELGRLREEELRGGVKEELRQAARQADHTFAAPPPWTKRVTTLLRGVVTRHGAAAPANGAGVDK